MTYGTEFGQWLIALVAAPILVWLIVKAIIILSGSNKSSEKFKFGLGLVIAVLFLVMCVKTLLNR